MRTSAALFTLGLFILISFSPLHAQTAISAPVADPNTVASPTPTPASQVPDEVLARLSGLIHSGKYPEAQQLTAGLLLAYPDDERLTKAKTLLDKIESSKTATVPIGQPANSVPGVQPAAGLPDEQLTGMDKVEYNSLIELGREAQQAADLDQQKRLLQQFMDKSSPFLQKHPKQLLLWQVRAASAISLNDPLAGYEAGQILLGAGAADSSDSNLQHLLAQLNLKGWLDERQATMAAARQKVHPAQSEAEKMLTEAAVTTGLSKISGFTSETFVVKNKGSDPKTIRYDQVKTFQVSKDESFCTVVVRGDMPRTWFDTKDWAPDLYFLVWQKRYCSDAQKFANALSTLAKEGASPN